MKYNLFASAAQPCPSSQLTAELPGVSLWVGPHLLTFHQNCSFPAFTNFAHTKPEPVLINPLDLHQQSSVQPLIFSLITSPTSLWCLFSPGPSAWESSPSSSLLWAWNVLSFISFAFFFFCCCTFSVVGLTHRLSYLVRWNSDLLFCFQPAFACLY